MLFEIKRILVCSDLSPKSDEVLRDAELLRQRVGAEVDVLYVSDIGIHLDFSATETKKETYYDTFVESLAEDLKHKLRAQIERTGLQGNALFSEGSIVEEINRLILTGPQRYDLLIIGHHSKIGVVHHLIGSVARKIISDAPIPTIVVKKKIEFKTIAAFIDGTGPIDWMVSSTLDFYRSLKFEKVEFISLWMDLPLSFHKEEVFKNLSEQIKDEVHYFSREGEKCIVRVEATHDLMVSYHLIRIIEEDGIDLALMRRNRGKKLNKKIIGSETQRILDLESTNLLIMPV